MKWIEKGLKNVIKKLGYGKKVKSHSQKKERSWWIEKLEVRTKTKILSMLFCLEKPESIEKFYYLQLFTAYRREIHTHMQQNIHLTLIYTYANLCLLMHTYAQKCSIEVQC